MTPIKDLSYLYEHEHYIKYRCPNVRDIYCTGLYFKDENNPENSGINISYHGYPEPLSKKAQAQILLAINAMCDTDFVLED